MGLRCTADSGAHFTHCVTVPGGSRRDSAGIKGAVNVLAVNVTDTLRAVGHADGRDSEPWDCIGMESVDLAGDEIDFFVDCHLRHEFRGAVFVFLGDLGGSRRN